MSRVVVVRVDKELRKAIETLANDKSSSISRIIKDAVNYYMKLERPVRYPLDSGLDKYIAVKFDNDSYTIFEQKVKMYGMKKGEFIRNALKYYIYEVSASR